MEKSLLSVIKPTRLAFIRGSKHGLDFWENIKSNSESARRGKVLMSSSRCGKLENIETTYVSVKSLEEKARIPDLLKRYTHYHSPLIWNATVGFMSKNWTYYGKTEEFRFGTGLYCSAHELLLVDDVFEWAHHRINSDKVRTAWDLMVEMHRAI